MSINEKLDAVVAECERRCPKRGSERICGYWKLVADLHLHKTWKAVHIDSNGNEVGGFPLFYIITGTASQIEINIAYDLLGLAVREERKRSAAKVERISEELNAKVNEAIKNLGEEMEAFRQSENWNIANMKLYGDHLNDAVQLLLKKSLNNTEFSRSLEDVRSAMAQWSYQTQKSQPVPFFESQLHELCNALGWQGGTYHRVLDEVKRLKDERTTVDELVEALSEIRSLSHEEYPSNEAEATLLNAIQIASKALNQWQEARRGER